MYHLYYSCEPIEAFVAREGMNVFLFRIADFRPEPVAKHPLRLLLDHSNALLGARGGLLGYVSADNYRARERAWDFFAATASECSRDDFLVIPYADGGLVTACHSSMPFHQNPDARQADWWEPDHRLRPR